MAKHKEDKASYIDVTSQNFPEQVLNAQQMVIVDFSSDRSSSCEGSQRGIPGTCDIR